MILKKVILRSSRVILDKKRSRIFDITGIFTSVLTRLKIQKQLVQVTSIQMILRTYIQIQVMLKGNLPMLLIHSWIIHFWCMVSQWINSHLESRLSDTYRYKWRGRTRNLYLGSSVGPPSPVDSISERTRSTSYSERRPSSSQFQELSFNTTAVHFCKTVHFENLN